MARPMTKAEWIAAMKLWQVPVKYYAGWDTRGRPGDFDTLNGVMIHHTGSDAGQSDAYLDFLFKTGRPADGIPGPLCHSACDMDGDLHVGAIGRANHAGRGSVSVLAAVSSEDYRGFSAELAPGLDTTDGNAHFYGCEVRYDGGQPMTPKQYAAAVRWAAAICHHYGWSALSVIGHREWTRRKPDPGNCPMTKFRAAVAALLKAGPPKATTPPAAGVTPTPPTGGTMSLTQDDKNWIEGRLQAYSNFLVLNRQQTTERDLDAIQAQLAEIDATVDRIEDDTDDGTVAP